MKTMRLGDVLHQNNTRYFVLAKDAHELIIFHEDEVAFWFELIHLWQMLLIIP